MNTLYIDPNYNSPCFTADNFPQAFTKTPAQISPIFKPDIDAYLTRQLFSLFQIHADGDGYPTYDLIGIFSSISDAASQLTGLFTIIDRATLNSQADDRYSIPYDFIIEPMTVTQPAPAHIYHACEQCTLTHNLTHVCSDCTKYAVA